MLVLAILVALSGATAHTRKPAQPITRNDVSYRLYARRKR